MINNLSFLKMSPKRQSNRQTDFPPCKIHNNYFGIKEYNTILPQVKIDKHNSGKIAATFRSKRVVKFN